MEAPNDKRSPRNITLIMVGVVIIAIVIITALTVTAILSGPPALP